MGLAEAIQWLQLGDSDMKAARVLMSGGLWSQSCFYAQQAAEKALKAELLARGLHFPKTHDLAALVGIAQGADPAFPAFAVECATLNAYAVTTRYEPEAAWAIDGEEAQAAVTYAQSVMDHCGAGLRGAGGPSKPTA